MQRLWKPIVSPCPREKPWRNLRNVNSAPFCWFSGQALGDRARRVASVGAVSTQEGWRMCFRRVCCSDCWRARKQVGPAGVHMFINSVGCSNPSNRQRVSTLNALGSGEIVYVSCTGNTPSNACALTFFARQGFGVVVVPLVARCSTRIGGTLRSCQVGGFRGAGGKFESSMRDASSSNPVPRLTTVASQLRHSYVTVTS